SNDHQPKPGTRTIPIDLVFLHAISFPASSGLSGTEAIFVFPGVFFVFIIDMASADHLLVRFLGFQVLRILMISHGPAFLCVNGLGIAQCVDQ
ncbi:hypothetical protein MMB01_23855, partial [Salmonella enterica]|nr:hypothetical protein [Salmonella enterica]